MRGAFSFSRLTFGLGSALVAMMAAPAFMPAARREARSAPRTRLSFGGPSYSRRATTRSPDEQVRRLNDAADKRRRKIDARLRCKAHGGWSTLAERTAAGVAGV